MDRNVSKDWNEATNLKVMEFKWLCNHIWGVIIHSLFCLVPFRLAAPGSKALSFHCELQLHWWSFLFVCLVWKGMAFQRNRVYLFLNNKSLNPMSHISLSSILDRQWSIIQCGKDRSSLSGMPCQKPASLLFAVGVPL